MYKAITAKEYKKMLSLPDNYVVDGVLSYGAWDEKKQRIKIIESLKKLRVRHSARVMKGFLSHALEVAVENKRYWFIVVYGGAILSEYIHLASILGSKKNIHIGSCGGLYPKMSNMDLVVPTWSYGNESTTRTYDREAIDFKHYPNKQLTNSLKKKLPKTYPVIEGPIITNQAMMGETWSDVDSWSKQGYYGVEMETAVVFSVSKHFNVPSAALLYVSDNLIKGQTVGDESHKRGKKLREIVKDNMRTAGIITLISS